MENIKSAKNVVLVAVIGGLVGALACLAVVLMVALPGHSAVAADKTASDLNAVVASPSSEEYSAASDNPLMGKTIFLYDTHHGVALSDEQAAKLAAQSEARGLSSKFSQLATSGQTVVDPVSGATYAVAKAGDEVHLGFSGAEVYILDGYGLDALVRGQLDEADFTYYGEIEGEFGTIKLYL